MKKIKLIKQNDGFSLVEIIVVLSIISFVMTAFLYFISVGSKAITTTKDEADIQLMAQTTTNQLQNLLMGATTIALLDDTDTVYNVTDPGSGLLTVKRLLIDKKVFMLDDVNNILYFYDNTGFIESDFHTAALTISIENLLERYLVEFKLSLNNLYSSGYVDLYLKFEKDGNVAESSQKVQIRNYK